MLLMHLRIAFRQFTNHKVLSFINVVGLSLGLATCYVILVYVSYQTSFDQHNEELANSYVVTAYDKFAGWTESETPVLLGPAIKAEIPGIRQVARWQRYPTSLKIKDGVANERQCVYADLAIFDILTMPLISGSIDREETGRDFLVISETMAKKYFSGVKPIGQLIVISCGSVTRSLLVTAVMRDLPETSTFRADLICPLAMYEAGVLAKTSTSGLPFGWSHPDVITYLLLSKNAIATDLSGQLEALSKRHQVPYREYVYKPFPLADIYLHPSSLGHNQFPHGSITDVYAYSGAALLLLFIATANYLMLGIGRASLRTKEAGMRKILGATRFDLFWQLIVEALLVTTVSIPIALGLVELLNEQLTGVLGIGISNTYFHRIDFVLAFLGIGLCVGIIVGAGVAFHLFQHSPMDILKNLALSGPRGVVFRRTLMAIQMAIFLGLTLTSLIIYRQLLSCEQGDLGFDIQHTVVLYPDRPDFGSGFQAFRAELMKNPDILSVSGSSFLPGTVSRGVFSVPRHDNPAERITIEGLTVTQEFVETMGLQMITGSSFTGRTQVYSEKKCLINETAAKAIGFSDPIDQIIVDWTVIGVVKDFNMHDLHERISPMLIQEVSTYIREVAVKVVPGSESKTITFIQQVAQHFNAGKPFEYESYYDRLGGLYEQEHKFSIVIEVATGICIIVACLGILGISIFLCQKRVKEIGIRKVLGASMGSIYAMIVKEFMLLILLSAAIGFPLAIWLVGNWMNDFAYRIHIGPMDLLVSLSLGIAVVLVTVSAQVLKVALANPVQSLRYE